MPGARTSRPAPSHRFLVEPAQAGSLSVKAPPPIKIGLKKNITSTNFKDVILMGLEKEKSKETKNQNEFLVNKF
ncbi:MAG: hypothetical protein WCX74_03910 [Candidatus Paceibacterota bacterium]